VGIHVAKLLLFLLLFGFWFGLSGQTKPFLLGCGLLTCGVLTAISIRFEAEIWGWSPRALALAVVTYLPWLLAQIVAANVRVIYLTLHPALPIAPCMVRVPCTLTTPLGRTIFANSITLTPGTVSVALEEGAILVHAITRADADSLLSGEMHDRVARLEQVAT
jgi:multicomponent Na+:H+ antiporter subunit E